ncbi:hypothetical protein [Methylovorus glucosotrophus]|uniref:Uncharacterized protein n=1 Tax=Methylovorus glucosotrophus (strain SIP3-4) TaxID=582744 RepID=C6XE85_METGS|nr:hypothetical protein [Methylovorus glucosotrophus]ACT50860.1 hypothetical protein Msip34_1615 [Methylovorus glucosotrophus SIP3-4]
MANVTFPTALGGDGSTVSDDNDPVTGLGNGGHRTRFVPSLKNIVAIAQMVVNTTTNLASKASQVDLNATNSELDALTAQVESSTSSINTSLALKAPIASPAFTGTPTAPTPSTNDNTTKVATTAFVMANSARNQDATASQKGVVELATATEIKSLDSTRAIAADQMQAAVGFAAMYESPQQTITSGGSLTIAHGLGRTPVMVSHQLVCVTAEQGFSVGDRLNISPLHMEGTNVNRGMSVISDATNIGIRFGISANVFAVPHFSTGTIAGLTNANWRLVVRAWG